MKLLLQPDFLNSIGDKIGCTSVELEPCKTVAISVHLHVCDARNIIAIQNRSCDGLRVFLPAARASGFENFFERSLILCKKKKFRTLPVISVQTFVAQLDHLGKQNKSATDWHLPHCGET